MDDNSSTINSIQDDSVSIQTNQLIDQQALNSIHTTINQMPTEAADTDLIEKEWINTLKSAIGSSSDPHKMQENIKKIKAEYLKKRYGKVINKED